MEPIYRSKNAFLTSNLVIGLRGIRESNEEDIKELKDDFI
jgi:hypothetical protein